MLVILQNVVTALVSRTKAKLEVAGLSTVTTNNPDLIEPITTALLEMGIQPDTFGTVTDADIQKVSADDVAELLDRSTLRVLMNVKGNLSRVDIRVGQRSENLSQLSKELEGDIKALSEKIASIYPPAANDSSTTLQAGTLDLNFQANASDECPIL